MRKIIILFLVLSLGLFLLPSVKALDDYVNADDETQYGWHLVGTEDNKACWEFDEDGNLSYCYAADGDFGDSQHVNNFAIRNLAINAGDTYSVETTFIPSEDTNASIERTYGIVCYYQDADNYLIYWLQQKSSQWSGQFYGRVGGLLRYFYIPEVVGNIEVTNYWRGTEFADMWWDDSKAVNSNLCGDSTALCNHTVTLKVESEVTDLELLQVWSDATETFNDEQYHCRKFTLHQIVDGNDFSVVYYIRDLDETTGDFYTGIYSNGFNYEPADFTITTTTTNFAQSVEDTISLLPAVITNSNQIGVVEYARVQYEDLLSYKADVSADSVTKLEEAEDKVGAFIDEQIEALDDTVETYKDDVDALSQLFNNLPSYLQDKVSKTEEFANHVKNAKTWTYNDPSKKEEDNPTEDNPKTDDPTQEEDSKTDDKKEEKTDDNPTVTSGCGSAIITSLFTVVFLAGACLVLENKKH